MRMRDLKGIGDATRRRARPGLLAAGKWRGPSAMSKAETIYDKVRALPEPVQAAVLQVVESLGAGQAPRPSGGSNTLGMALRFQRLADTWKRETRYLSFMEQQAMHPAYQPIQAGGRESKLHARWLRNRLPT